MKKWRRAKLSRSGTQIGPRKHRCTRAHTQRAIGINLHTHTHTHPSLTRTETDPGRQKDRRLYTLTHTLEYSSWHTLSVVLIRRGSRSRPPPSWTTGVTNSLPVLLSSSTSLLSTSLSLPVPLLLSDFSVLSCPSCSLSILFWSSSFLLFTHHFTTFLCLLSLSLLCFFIPPSFRLPLSPLPSPFLLSLPPHLIPLFPLAISFPLDSSLCTYLTFAPLFSRLCLISSISFNSCINMS